MVANVTARTNESSLPARSPRSFIDRSLAWSPDGSTIVVGAVTEENLQSQEIFSVDASGWNDPAAHVARLEKYSPHRLAG